VIALAIVLAAAAVVAFVVLSDRRAGPGDGGAPAAGDPGADQLARELAAAYFADDDRGKAAAAIAPLVERPRPDADDLVSAAAIELRTANVDGARAYLDRARELAPDSPRVLYNLARLERWNGSYEGALPHLERVRQALPDDVPTLLMLGDTYENLDRPADARAIYEQVLSRGVDSNGSWHLTALYRSSLIARDAGDEPASERYRREFEELQGRGLAPPDGTQLDIGLLGGLPSPPPRGNEPSGTGRVGALASEATRSPLLAGSSGALVADVDNNGKLDVIGYGPAGIRAALLYPEPEGWEESELSDLSADGALAFDFGNDDDLDLLTWRGNEVELLVADAMETRSGYGWVAKPGAIAPLPGPVRGVTPVDYDHEGDLDLVLFGDFGVRLLRDDGAAGPTGSFTDATAEAGLEGAGAAAWCLIEDFDTDRDIDLLFGPRPFLASNLRSGRFEDVAAERLAGAGEWTVEPVAADLDGDGRPDLIRPLAAGGAELWINAPSGRLTRSGEPRAIPGAAGKPWAHDLDLDGALDVFWQVEGRLVGLLAPGLPAERPLELELPAGELQALADVEGDRAWDLVLLDGGGAALHVLRPENHGLRLGYRGSKDNRRGIGAVVELRSGPIYRRILWRGEAELVGVGQRAETDLVRVTWPNGVVQYDDRRELSDRAATGDTLGFLQSEGLAGSCPFLYTWNGATFEFVTDVLGITPLGLPMAPGVLVPPDHDEYVLVRGEQLRERDGWLELQLTEELREVTYLDHLRLDAVDHPEGSEIYPNERFTFPPFPEPHTHTVVAPLAPLSATDAEGREWAAELAAIDGTCAAPLVPVGPQFMGIAHPHYLELAFDPARVADAPRLRLLMTGWFWWSDASVNVALARDPRYAFVPPTLQVPDGEGGWRDAGPPVGFPAGKTKTMVIDLEGILPRADPRLRVSSTLRLYWDSIRLAVDGDGTELRVTSLEPASARLWERGFSEPDEPEDLRPETFDWERLERYPRWNPHPGLYTRLGEVLPLLAGIDDRFAIMASGDALHVRFDAASLPPLAPGWRRDYLVFLDGWAKDRDPNTLEALYVEPLPFHGMSGYPYGPDEAFPDTPEHRAWRREWNTRAAPTYLPLVAGGAAGP
jgi:tetratricopeptide (TPR) repeat protein